MTDTNYTNTTIGMIQYIPNPNSLVTINGNI